jgi:hypothetical protein
MARSTPWVNTVFVGPELRDALDHNPALARQRAPSRLLATARLRGRRRSLRTRHYVGRVDGRERTPTCHRAGPRLELRRPGAQFRRIAAAHDLEPAERTIKAHNPAGPLASLWRTAEVDALAGAPDVVEARARRRAHTPEDELAAVAALLAPYARKGERVAATLRRVLRRPASKRLGRPLIPNLDEIMPPNQRFSEGNRGSDGMKLNGFDITRYRTRRIRAPLR